MSNTFSKSSTYVRSLVNFTLDTKPYHSKLTEVAVEYRFEDAVGVSVVDAVVQRMVHKAGWLHTFYSGGEVTNRTFNLKRLEVPHLLRTERNDDPTRTPGAFKVGRDESPSPLGVPYVYDQRFTEGIADAWLERVGGQVEPLVPGCDLHRVYGAADLRISDASPTDTDQSPRWQETRQEGVLATVNSATRSLAVARLDPTQPWSIANSDPRSANYRIRQVLNAIQAQLLVTPNPSAQANLNALFTTLNTPDLPQSYEALWVTLEAEATPVITNPETGVPFTAWRGEDGTPPGSTYVDDLISRHTPSAYFYGLSDLRARESGSTSYADLEAPGFTVTGVQWQGVPDEWLLTVTNVSPVVLEVRGEVNGFAGAVVVGAPFSSTHVSFSTATAPGTAVEGTTYRLTPRGRLVVAPDAPREAWSLIKTDPLAHDRPTFTSTRYGHLRSLSGVLGDVTLLDPTLPTGTLVLRALTSTTFSLTSDAEPSYTGTATVGVVFNDGRLGFTLVPGTAQGFSAGDTFYLRVVNDEARTQDLDLYYGYDLDSLDNQEAVYSNQDPSSPLHLRPLDFRYDSRFTDYDLSNLNLQVTQAAVTGTRYRLAARPDGLPISILQRDGSGPSNFIDLSAGEGSIPIFSMPGDANPAPDLAAYYASTFRLERSTDGGATWTTVETVIPIGSTYSNPTEGISFTLAPGSKPFIAVQTDGGVMGGDVFQWTVVNPAPRLQEAPILAAPSVPRLVMHPDGFWDAPPATWLVTFTSATAYTVSATYAAGPSTGLPVPGYPVTGDLSIPGPGLNRNLTFKSDHVHFTVVRGRRGFAAGDTFRFTTFDRKPSILVHGSVSGWQPDAEVGRWHWNGRIGFKVDLPTATVFQGGTPTSTGVTVTRLRPDAPTTTYSFTKVGTGPTATYAVTRPDRGTIGFCPVNGTFRDAYLTVTVAEPASFQVHVTADPLSFWSGTDTVVVRAAVPPSPGDHVSVRKATADRLGLNLDYTGSATIPDTTPLGLTAVDPAYISTSTGGVPIETHSPEVAILSGWVPLTLTPYDATSSIAHFPDVATEVRISSAVSGEPIGRIFSTGSLNEPIRFEWDQDFFTRYLPLNAASSVVTYGSHLDEPVHVHLTERLFLSQSGGALAEDALFTDALTVTVADATHLSISLDRTDALTATILDGPFGGFLPGYDNLPLDAETSTSGRYDTGEGLVSHFIRASDLARLPTPTIEEQVERDTLTALVGAYLQPGGVLATTLPQLLAALAADPYRDTDLSPQLGRPVLGHAIDITTSPTATASTAITEVLILTSVEAPTPFGALSGGFSSTGSSTATLLITGTPPTGPIPSAYQDYDTPLHCTTPVTTIEVDLSPAPATTPTFYAWTPTMASPTLVTVVTQVSPRRWRFDLPGASEVKVIVT